MEQKTVVDTSLRELRRHGSDDFPIGIYRDDFSEFEHGQIAWHWHDEIQFDYIIKGTILVQVGTSEFVLMSCPPRSSTKPPSSPLSSTTTGWAWSASGRS